MELKNFYYFTAIIILIFSFTDSVQATPIKDKIAVLILSWGAPDGDCLEYAWQSHQDARIGDRTRYPGQPCKFGHMGEFPYETHIGLLPWGLTCAWPGAENIYDNSGLYQLIDDIYVSIHPDIPSLTKDLIPSDIPVIAAIEEPDMRTGGLLYPPDPRTGEDTVAGWYKIGSFEKPFPNGAGDIFEGAALVFKRYATILGGPAEKPEACLESVYARDILERTMSMLEESFGDRVDVRFGMYTAVPGITKSRVEIAEEFANEGFTKMVIARETTDNNNYANDIMGKNYIMERLCEIGKLDEFEFNQTRQVGRTPEFETMNVMNIKRFIEAYPEGSRIAIIYTTRGTSWGSQTGSGTMKTQREWFKEVGPENRYLNFLSWKKAIKAAYGNRYKLVFTKGGVESDLVEDNFYAYALVREDRLVDGVLTMRQAIQKAKEEGYDKIIAPYCHSYYDSVENLIDMREINGIPLISKEGLQTGNFDLTYCEDAAGSEVDCSSGSAVAKISIPPAFSNFTDEFAASYYVVLRGTLEKFGLYPKNVLLNDMTSKLVTKLDGGTVEVTNPSSLIRGAKIEIPPDPYPDRPEGFTWETAIAPGDPNETNDCLWEDTTIIIAHQLNPNPMKATRPVGPAVHFGPYRNFFNRDVSITIPYSVKKAGNKNLRACIYNHITNDWDTIEADTVDKANGLVVFKTQVLGLFRAGVDR